MNIIREYVEYNDKMIRCTGDKYHSFKNVTDRLYEKCMKNIGPLDDVHDSELIQKILFHNIIFNIKTRDYYSIVSHNHTCSICGSSFRAILNVNTLQFIMYQQITTDVCDASLYQNNSKLLEVNGTNLYITNSAVDRHVNASMKDRFDQAEIWDDTFKHTANFILPYEMGINIYSNDNHIHLMDDFSDTMELVGTIQNMRNLYVSCSPLDDARFPVKDKIRVEVKSGLYKITNHSETMSEFSDNQTAITIEPIMYY